MKRETYDELSVDLISLGKEEETSDAGVEDLVIVSLSSKTEVGEEHVDVVSTSAKARKTRANRRDRQIRGADAVVREGQ